MAAMRYPNRLFSAAQPSGDLHLGNYLGAIRQWKDLQSKYPSLFCIADLHAITADFQPADLRANTYHLLATILAAGIDPKQAIIFLQSDNSDHSYLAWLLTCVARYGWLNRMTQFKEKSAANKEQASVGLFSYPILMAADILVYRVTHVPIGDDQQQHLELTRDIARKFNNDYCHDSGDYFPITEALVLKTGNRVMSLRDATKKMSKSDPSDLGKINLSDSDENIAAKISKAKSDSHPLPDNMVELAKRPEATNLLGIYAALTNCTVAEVTPDFAGAGFAKLKRELTAATIATIAPIRTEINKYLQDKAELDNILQAGAKSAHAISKPIITEVKQRLGLRT